MKNPADLESTPSRRDFCKGACQAASFVALGTLVGCGGSPTSASTGTPLTTVTSTVAGRSVSIAVGSTSPLANAGSMALADTSIGAFLIARTSASAFTVLTATCTHEGCTVSNASGSNFACPCHGSQFTASGSVAKGPASSSLRSFPASFDGSTLTFTG